MRPMTVTLACDPSPDLPTRTAAVYAVATIARLRRGTLNPDQTAQILSRITQTLRNAPAKTEQPPE